MLIVKLNKTVIFSALSICLIVGLLKAQSSCANEPQLIKINEIIEGANSLDGKSVIIQGEVIGDVMPRKDYVWFNVQDASGVMGVWASGKLAEQILVAGDYEFQGDIVEVSGIFKKADRDLGGEICIRAEMVDILNRGKKSEHTLNPVKVKIALVLSILCATLLIFRMIIRKR